MFGGGEFFNFWHFFLVMCWGPRFSCDQPHPCRSGLPRVSNPSHPPRTGWTNPRDSALKDCGKALWKVGNPSERHASKRKLQKKHVFSRGVSGKIGGTPSKWMVKIKEKPVKMDDLGVYTLIFGNTHVFWMLGPYTPNILPKSSPLKPLQSQKEKLTSSFPIIFQGRAVQLRGILPRQIKSWKINCPLKWSLFWGMWIFEGGRLANCHTDWCSTWKKTPKNPNPSQAPSYHTLRKSLFATFPELFVPRSVTRKAANLRHHTQRLSTINSYLHPAKVEASMVTDPGIVMLTKELHRDSGFKGTWATLQTPCAQFP